MWCGACSRSTTEARKYSLANYGELKKTFIGVTGLDGAIVDKQLKERTELTHNRVGPAQRIDPGGRPRAAEGGRDRSQRRRRESGRRSCRRPLRGCDELSLLDARDASGNGRGGHVLVSMTASVEPTEAARAPSNGRLAHVLRPALGFLLPVALAVFWEAAVRLGFSNGRLVPPPSVIWNTFVDLAATSELQHALATLWRVAWGFGLGVPPEPSSARSRAIPR